jgi:hypothetical protein
LSNVDIFKLIKEEDLSTDYERHGLPLPENNVCKFLGVYKGYVPFRRTKIVYSPISEAIKYFYDYFGNKEVLKEYFSGSFEYSYHNLKLMATENDGGYTIEEMVDGVLSRSNIDFKIPYISYWSIEMVNGILTKPKAYPGLLSSLYIYHCRQLTTGFVKTYAKDYMRRMCRNINKYTLDNSFITIGGREKLVTPSIDYKQLKTRIVLMLEDVPTVIGQSIAVPLTKAFQRLNSGFCFIGRSLEQRNYYDILKEGNSDCIMTINCNADFSGHDNEVKEKQIVLAFSILRLCFPYNWSFMDKLFMYNLSSMVNKNIVLPGSGFVYKITKGIGTGHPFTSLVNTICAYCIFATAINKVCTDYEVSLSRVWVAGDDVLCKVPLDKLNAISEELLLNSGMKINNISDSSGPLIASNHNYHISFLKRKFMFHGVGWNDKELVSNLIHNPRGQRSTIQECERVINMLMNGPCDFEMNGHVKQYIRNMFANPTFRLVDVVPHIPGIGFFKI